MVCSHGFGSKEVTSYTTSAIMRTMRFVCPSVCVLSVCLSICTCAYAGMYVRTYVCMYVCILMHVCARVGNYILLVCMQEKGLPPLALIDEWEDRAHPLTASSLGGWLQITCVCM